MNLIEGEVAPAADSCRLGAAGSVRLLGRSSDLRRFAGRAVAVGLRPEALHEARPSDEDVVRGTVKLVEALGPELLVYVDVDAKPVVHEQVVEGAVVEAQDTELVQGLLSGTTATLVARLASDSRLEAGMPLALGLDALALAGQVIVATAIGAGRFEDGAHAARHLLRVALRWGVLAAAVVVATSGLLPRVFTDDPAVRHQAIAPLVLLGVMTVPGAVAFLFDGVYLGTSDFAWMQRGTLLAAVTFVPAAVIAFARPGLGLVFLWSALVVWMTARAVLQHWWFRTGRWTVAAHQR